jgi:hypothetical protein
MIQIELSKILITLSNWKKIFICYPTQPLVHVNSNDLNESEHFLGQNTTLIHSPEVHFKCRA